MSNVSLNLDGLDKLEKILKKHKATIKVGILGSKPREDGGSNATIGLVHEFGSVEKNIPERSFLRLPLTWKLPYVLDQSKLLTKKDLESAIEKGEMFQLFKEIGRRAVAIVQDAFDSGTYWIPSNMTNKKVHQTLVESQQLRDSIEYEVKIDKQRQG